MWIRLELSRDKTIYIAFCYFAPSGSRFVSTDQESSSTEASPYACLSKEIMEYSTLGEVFLMGDFNARTRSEQCEAYDYEDPEVLHTLHEEATMRDSTNRGPGTTYERHLLRLGSQHRLVIYNQMAQWPISRGLICMPHGVTEGGGSTLDYILGPRQATRLITSFTIPPIPIGADHAYLSLPPSQETPLYIAP